MPMYRNIGGTWRTGTLWRNIAGTWRQGILWRNIGGVWKNVSGNALTVGVSGGNAGFSDGSISALVIGSFTPASMQFPGYTGTPTDLYHGGGNLTLRLSGDYPNSGWTTLYVNGAAYSRASAAYFNSPGAYTHWIWTVASPFGGAGTVAAVFAA